jgi:hypothetical protein
MMKKKSIDVLSSPVKAGVSFPITKNLVILFLSSSILHKGYLDYIFQQQNCSPLLLRMAHL